MPAVKIKGMSCQHCVASVTEALKKIDGITRVEVDLDAARATYEADREVPTAEISAAISAIGFEVE